MVIAGFVCSIVGIVFSILGTWFSVISLPISIVGLVMAVLGGKKVRAAGAPTGLATAALVLGIVATCISAISFFTCGICTICVAAEANAIDNALDNALKKYY